MKKFLLFLSLYTVLLLSMAACSSPDPVQPSLSSGTPDGSPAVTTPAGPDETAPAPVPSAPGEREEISAMTDDGLMYFLLNTADGAEAEAAQYELGNRFLARPEDILNTMTWFNGAQPQNWPDGDMDGADWLVQMLVSEFKVMRGEEDGQAFEGALAGFTDEDCGGMARNVRTAWENYGTL